MLVMSSKIKYGIAALLELVNYYGKGLVQTKVIAERRSIPLNYLEQLMSQLNKGGLVRAVRGSKGGYELALSPEKVTFLHVWEIMEGETEQANSEPQISEAAHDLYRQAEEEVKKVFSVSLLELLERQQRYDALAQEAMMFHI